MFGGCGCNGLNPAFILVLFILLAITFGCISGPGCF